MSRLLLGKRMQFLHILLTRSSLRTMISWLQYWILSRPQEASLLQPFQQRKQRNEVQYLFDLHGLVVNTENGTLCLNSSVMWSARGGLWRTNVCPHFSKATRKCPWMMSETRRLPWQYGAWTRVFRTRNKHKTTTAGFGQTCFNTEAWTNRNINILPAVNAGIWTNNISEGLQWF